MNLNKNLNKFFSQNNNKKINLYDKLEKLKSNNFPNKSNEYRYMLRKGLIRYYQIKWVREKRKFYFMTKLFFSGFVIFQIIKYYYVLYYYIMWDIDIRKPRVSDYIIERFR